MDLFQPKTKKTQENIHKPSSSSVSTMAGCGGGFDDVEWEAVAAECDEGFISGTGEEASLEK